METAVCTTSDVVTPNLYVWVLGTGVKCQLSLEALASLYSELERLSACLYHQWSHQEAVDRRTCRQQSKARLARTRIGPIRQIEVHLWINDGVNTGHEDVPSLRSVDGRHGTAL